MWLLAFPFLVFCRPTVNSVVLGGAVASIGLFVRAWAAGSIRKNESLATSGPYAFTRNPLYLGSLLLGGGVALAGGHWVWPLAFFSFFAAVYRPTIAREDARLAELFGDDFRVYAERVPAFLPGFPVQARGEPVEERFRWRRYGRNREWEALLGATAAFALLTAKALGAI